MKQKYLFIMNDGSLVVVNGTMTSDLQGGKASTTSQERNLKGLLMSQRYVLSYIYDNQFILSRTQEWTRLPGVKAAALTLNKTRKHTSVLFALVGDDGRNVPHSSLLAFDFLISWREGGSNGRPAPPTHRYEDFRGIREVFIIHYPLYRYEAYVSLFPLQVSEDMGHLSSARLVSKFGVVFLLTRTEACLS